MLQVAIAQGLPGGYYMSKYSGEEIDALLDGAQSAQDAVQLTGITKRTVTLDASELQAAIDSTPRLLTENLTFQPIGTLAGPVEISGFYGPGMLSIIGQNRFSISNTLTLVNCYVPFNIQTINFQEPDGWTSNDYLVNVHACFGQVQFTSCVFTGYGTQGKGGALSATYGSHVEMASCTAKNLGIAAFSARTASIFRGGGSYQRIAGSVWGQRLPTGRCGEGPGCRLGGHG